MSILEADSRVGDIHAEVDLEVVAKRIADAGRPVVVLGECVGYQELLDLRAVRMDVGIIVLASHKSLLLSSLLESVRASVVLPGMADEEVSAEVFRASIASLLTDRELEVFVHLRGRSRNAEIARMLGISVETVRAHAKSIYRKLGIQGRAELV